MQRYVCGLATIDFMPYPAAPYRGHGWHISLDRHPSCKNLRSFVNGRSVMARAVMIHAASAETAKYVTGMVYAASCLITPGHIFPPDEIEVVLASGARQDSGAGDGEQSQRIAGTWDGLTLACMIAAKASHRKAYQYALFKFLLSQQVFPVDVMDLDPSHWWPARFVFDSAEYHVRCAQAIVLAYSVLEELSLELRASPSNPSLLGGKWNPVVRSELEGRLSASGVNLSEPLLWVLRDTPTRIERARAPEGQSKVSWARSKIRDSDLDIVDAIAYASWLRSKVSAHRLRDLAASLSLYDVSNVQHLARRLLLEKLGFWRYRERRHS